jgi:hypothetical protein
LIMLLSVALQASNCCCCCCCCCQHSCLHPFVDTVNATCTSSLT